MSGSLFTKYCMVRIVFKNSRIIFVLIVELFDFSALGFLHMQSSFDRDRYVEILWGNIEPGKEDQFRIEGDNVVSHMGGKYDYASIMHYDEKAFSKNKQITIRTKVNYNSIGLW